MEYVTVFLEGIITFISPCLLPMLPIYLIYFAGGSGEKNKRRVLVNACGFILGFTILFVTLGVFAGTVGRLLKSHETIVNVVTGLIVIVFGLNYTGLIRLKFLDGTRKLNKDVQNLGFFSAVLFGLVFAVGWTPCVGAFLGSALMLASQQADALKGAFMLLLYSLGLGIPFIISALLIDRLKSTFNFIKRHYRVINIISGLLLIVVGILMMTGLINKVLYAMS